MVEYTLSVFSMGTEKFEKWETKDYQTMYRHLKELEENGKIFSLENVELITR